MQGVVPDVNSDADAPRSDASTLRGPAAYLSCLVFNSRGILNKLHELRSCIDSSAPDVLCITETWLNKDVSDQTFTAGLNYSVYRCDRVRNDWGGVLILVNNSKVAAVEAVVLPAKYALLELVCVDVKGSNNSYRIINCYRKPSSDKDPVSVADTRLLVECLAELCLCDCSVVLVGDFNFPGIAWKDGTVLRNNTNAVNDDVVLANSCCDIFEQFVIHESLTQFVDEPTRYNTYSAAANVLDLVLSNDDFAIIDLKVLPPFGSSDHCCVEFKLVYSAPHLPPHSHTLTSKMPTGTA